SDSDLAAREHDGRPVTREPPEHLGVSVEVDQAAIRQAYLAELPYLGLDLGPAVESGDPERAANRHSRGTASGYRQQVTPREGARRLPKTVLSDGITQSLPVGKGTSEFERVRRMLVPPARKGFLISSSEL